MIFNFTNFSFIQKVSRVPRRINDTIQILPYRCGRQTSGERGRLNADTCGQRGRGSKTWQNLADVFYGWPQTEIKNYNS